MKVYLAGPMRGLPRYNFDSFHAAAAKLRAAGHEVVSPAEHDEEQGFDPSKDDESKLDMEALARWDLGQVRKAEAIVLLPGWEKSTGVAAEKALADWIQTPCYDYAEWARTGAFQEPARSDDTGTGEIRVVNDATGGEKGAKLARFDLLPTIPMWNVAEHYGRGSRKYADRNWEKGYAWSLSYAAMQRHLHQFWSGESIDEETGGHHLAAAVFHCLALMEFERTHPELDDRSK